jgi:hypothetical protein
VASWKGYSWNGVEQAGIVDGQKGKVEIDLWSRDDAMCFTSIYSLHNLSFDL